MNDGVSILKTHQSFLVCRKCSIFMKIFNLGVYGVKILETDLEICFMKQILDAVMKLESIGFLSILKMQYIIGKVFSFSVTLKLNFLVYCLVYCLVYSSINSA